MSGDCFLLNMFRFPKTVPLCLGGLCMVVGVAQAVSAGTRFHGRVLYRGTKTPAVGVLVEIVEAEDDGKPKDDDALASVRADAEGRFSVVLAQSTDEPVSLVASAVRISAKSGGDRRSEGYDLKTHRTMLGFLPHPSAAKPNTLFIERRRVGHSSAADDD